MWISFKYRFRILDLKAWYNLRVLCRMWKFEKCDFDVEPKLLTHSFCNCLSELNIWAKFHASPLTNVGDLAQTQTTCVNIILVRHLSQGSWKSLKECWRYGADTNMLLTRRKTDWRTGGRTDRLVNEEHSFNSLPLRGEGIKYVYIYAWYVLRYWKRSSQSMCCNLNVWYNQNTQNTTWHVNV